MEKKWILQKQGDAETVEALSQILKIDKILSNLLVQRKINTFDEAREFFRPRIEDLHNPFLMADMDKAVDRLEKALSEGEKILIYGDYDVDGTTSVALVYSFLKPIYSNIGYYIPDRYDEGYGVSIEGIDFAHKNGYSLIIALDCGIKAIKKVDYANEKHIEFIICDHHTPGETLPKAAAILNPKREDCNYPFKELSGCGVGFKFVQAYAQRKNIPFENLTPLLDLVAVSIASDIVSINGENRVLSYFGLEQLNKQPRIGLKSVIKISGLEGKQITVSDSVFKIGPRINAAGRIDRGSRAVDLLIAQTQEDANSIADKIDDLNTERKDLDHNHTEEAINFIKSDEKLINRKTTVVFNPEWHKGVIGIVASRLTETFYRPTVVLTESDGMVSGSARSVFGFNLYNAIEACADLLENFGGHMYAAGMTMKRENLEKFQEQFERVVSETITEEELTPQIDIDAKINFKDITPKFYRILRQMEPFGPENMTPIFLTDTVYDTGESRLVGKNLEHLKLELTQKGVKMAGIGFSLAKHLEIIKSGKPFKICYNVEENDFRGSKSLQIMVRDVKPM